MSISQEIFSSHKIFLKNFSIFQVDHIITDKTNCVKIKINSNLYLVSVPFWVLRSKIRPALLKSRYLQVAVSAAQEPDATPWLIHNQGHVANPLRQSRQLFPVLLAVTGR